MSAPIPYRPAPVPNDLPASAQRYLTTELNKIASLLQIMSGSLHLDPVYAPPQKARQGDIVYADGVLWDPGSGEGFYYLNSHGQWTPLG